MIFSCYNRKLSKIPSFFKQTRQRQADGAAAGGRDSDRRTERRQTSGTPATSERNGDLQAGQRQTNETAVSGRRFPPLPFPVAALPLRQLRYALQRGICAVFFLKRLNRRFELLLNPPCHLIQECLQITGLDA